MAATALDRVSYSLGGNRYPAGDLEDGNERQRRPYGRPEVQARHIAPDAGQQQQPDEPEAKNGESDLLSLSHSGLIVARPRRRG